MPIPKFKDVLCEQTGGVATDTLKRLNAIRVGKYEEITEAILHAASNKEFGVMVLAGAGGKAFLSRRRQVGCQVRAASRWYDRRPGRATPCCNPRHG
jgi:1,4-dihydroxy-2-naphthoyl-CoA synthase